LGVPLPAIRV